MKTGRKERKRNADVGETCCLRKAEWKDVKTLFRWVNDSEARKNSFHSEPVNYEEHVEWFKKKYKDGNCRIYIFCDGKLEVGMLRLDFEGNEAVISYSIAKEFRNKGYGKKIIEAAEEEIRQWMKSQKPYIETVSAKALVKKSNVASNRIFASLMYEKKGIEYKKEIKLEFEKETVRNC